MKSSALFRVTMPAAGPASTMTKSDRKKWVEYRLQHTSDQLAAADQVAEEFGTGHPAVLRLRYEAMASWCGSCGIDVPDLHEDGLWGP